MAIDSSKLLVAVKAYSRGNALPLDASEVQESLAAAQNYAKSATAYAGQTIKVLQDGKYETYVLNGTAGNYTLDKIGVDQSQLKQYVQVVDALPTSPEQGVIYINTADSKGYIFDGTENKVVFEDVAAVKADVETLKTDVAELKEADKQFAKLSGATFTGEVVLAADPSVDLGAATKQYVDKLVAGINSFTVGVVDADNPLPTSGYKTGQTFRVAAAGTYAGVKCEIGDLIIVVSDFADAAKDSDFLVVQANVDGAVTGAESAGDTNIAIFDGVTGKKVKDSGVTLAKLNDAIAKAHEHANKAVLDSYDKTQAEVLEAAATDAATKVDAAKGELQGKIDTLSETVDTKANSADVYAKAEVDDKLKPITDNLNTKVDAAGVKAQLDERLGDIADTTTVKDYIDTAVGSGGTASAEAIAKAKAEAIQEAKDYTDAAFTINEFN